MCDVAVADNEKVVRTISETTKRSLGFFVKAPTHEQNPFEFLFQKKLGFFLTHRKRSSRAGGACAVDHVMVAEQPRFRPPSLIPNKRVRRWRVFGV